MYRIVPDLKVQSATARAVDSFKERYNSLAASGLQDE